MESDFDEIYAGLESLRKQEPICSYIEEIAAALALYDWRSSSAPGLAEEERSRRAAFRGSGGYRELRRDVLRRLSDTQSRIAATADQVLERLGY